MVVTTLIADLYEELMSDYKCVWLHFISMGYPLNVESVVLLLLVCFALFTFQKRCHNLHSWPVDVWLVCSQSVQSRFRWLETSVHLFSVGEYFVQCRMYWFCDPFVRSSPKLDVSGWSASSPPVRHAGSLVEITHQKLKIFWIHPSGQCHGLLFIDRVNELHHIVTSSPLDVVRNWFVGPWIL